jgi:hypothetical protein
MTNEPSPSQILEYLKGKYLSTSTPKIEDKAENKENIPVGEESELSGEEAENRFLLSKLQNIQNELSKWLDILRSKL